MLFTNILFLINLTFFTPHPAIAHINFIDYFLRLPYSEMLEKRVFRSRANRRLVHHLHRRQLHWVHLNVSMIPHGNLFKSTSVVVKNRQSDVQVHRIYIIAVTKPWDNSSVLCVCGGLPSKTGHGIQCHCRLV